METTLLPLQARIGRTVDRDGPPTSLNVLEDIAALLSSPLDHAGATRPLLAFWFGPGGPHLGRAAAAVGSPAPLGLLEVGWRSLTLIALRQLCPAMTGGADTGAPLGAPPVPLAELVARSAPSARAAWRLQLEHWPADLAANVPSRGRVPNRPVAVPRSPSMPAIILRPMAEYRRLATAIVSSPDWLAAQGRSGREQRRTLRRLVDKALRPATLQASS